MLRFNPTLPEEVRELSFKMLYRQHWLKIAITDEAVTIDSRRRNHGPITVEVGGETRELGPGSTVKFSLERKRRNEDEDMAST
jgi:trehalose/maltose hydrolase-like predicted phosphorylase